MSADEQIEQTENETLPSNNAQYALLAQIHAEIEKTKPPVQWEDV